MTALLSFEWLKLHRRWMPRLVVLGSSGLVIVAFLLLSADDTERANLVLPRAWLAALSFSSFLAPFFWPVVGASWAGNEYDWGTIRAILTRRPDRIAHVLAALAVLVVGVGVGMLAILLAGTLGGIVTSHLRGGEFMTADVFSDTFLAALLEGGLTAWYVSGFYLLVAYAAATVARSAAVGVGFVLGSTLAQYLLRSIFPGTALATARAYEPAVSDSIVALALYGALCLAVTLVAVRARDVTA
jgi:hypothetical protein